MKPYENSINIRVSVRVYVGIQISISDDIAVQLHD